jgi:hypothetical protein
MIEGIYDSAEENVAEVSTNIMLKVIIENAGNLFSLSST